MLQGLFKKKSPQTGLTCGYCGWQGTWDDVHKAKVLNTDGTPYEIQVCPHCMRNGALIDHDAKK